MKKIWIFAVSATLLLLFAACSNGDNSATNLFPSTDPNVTATGADIGADAAKSIALENAGVAEADVARILAQLDYDDGRAVYDVEFYANNTEYDYEIDAYTGEILSYDHDVEGLVLPSNDPNVSADTQIDLETAKAAALEHAGLTASDVIFIKERTDYDDGRLVYDLEFYAGNTEYDYEIDANSGAILSYNFDIENYSRPTSNPSTDVQIDSSTAASIALSDAGLTQSQVSRLHTDFDYDDGRAVYDVEFYSGDMEYDYEIDANSGAILSRNVESIYD